MRVYQTGDDTFILRFQHPGLSRDARILSHSVNLTVFYNDDAICNNAIRHSPDSARADGDILRLINSPELMTRKIHAKYDDQKYLEFHFSLPGAE
jgi:hypothetical protein